VARAPWLARQGTNRADATADLYESHAVVQVTWGDGHLSYECAREGCDYTSGNPRSVASHFRAHVRKGEQEPVPSLRPSVAKDIPIDPDSIGNGRHTHEYTPSERLVRALAHFLEAAGTTDVTALAFAALRWAHERPDLEHLEREDREPMTDGQILARIRLLVGGRDVETEEALRNALATVDRFREALDEAERMGAERIAEVEERVANLAASAQAWEQTATTEKQRADSLQEDINAWMSLAPRYGTQE
jgi:hypothetical protein